METSNYNESIYELFSNDFEIDENDIFKNDMLNRKKDIIKLTNLFEIIGNRAVISVSSQWGAGKSAFIKLWEAYLKSECYKTVYFNSWECDFIEEPFISILSEITNVLDDDKKLNLKQEALKIAGILFKKSAGMFIENSTIKLLDNLINIVSKKRENGEDEERLFEFIKEIASEYREKDSQKLLSSEIDKYYETKNAFNEFRTKLKNISIKSNKPIVIFIDELDRCRPEYAIKILERIKHIFNVSNVIFVLAIDKSSLSNSIKTVYGEETDINGYLSRFIDIEYDLENKDDKKIYIKYLFEKYGIKSLFNNVKDEHLFTIDEIEGAKRKNYDIDYKSNLYFETKTRLRLYDEFLQASIWIITQLNISLRECEKIIAKLYIILKSSNQIVDRAKKEEYSIIYHFSYLIIFLCVLRNIDYKLYNEVKQVSSRFHKEYEVTDLSEEGDLRAQIDVLKDISKNKKLKKCLEFEVNNYGVYLSASILWMVTVDKVLYNLYPDIPEDKKQVLENDIKDFRIYLSNLSKIYSSDIAYFDEDYDDSLAKFIISRIELYDGLSLK